MTKEERKKYWKNYCKIEDIKILDYNAFNLALKITNFIDDWDYLTKKNAFIKKGN